MVLAYPVPLEANMLYLIQLITPLGDHELFYGENALQGGTKKNKTPGKKFRIDELQTTVTFFKDSDDRNGNDLCLGQFPDLYLK